MANQQRDIRFIWKKGNQTGAGKHKRETIRHIIRLMRLLLDGNTHTTKELAEKIGVCRRTIYSNLHALELEGVKVCFFKTAKSSRSPRRYYIEI